MRLRIYLAAPAQTMEHTVQAGAAPKEEDVMKRRCEALYLLTFVTPIATQGYLATMPALVTKELGASMMTRAQLQHPQS